MSNLNVLFFNISSEFISTLIDKYWSDHMSDMTAAIAATVVEITHRPGRFYQQLFLATGKLLTPNMYCWSWDAFNSRSTYSSFTDNAKVKSL